MGDVGGIPIAKLLQFLPLLLAGTGAIKDPKLAGLAGMAGGALPGMMGKPQQPGISQSFPQTGQMPNLAAMGGGQGLQPPGMANMPQMGGGQGMQGLLTPQLLSMLFGGGQR